MKTLDAGPPIPAGVRATRRDRRAGSPVWVVAAWIEASTAAIAVLYDLAIPSLVLVSMAVVSLVIRRQGVRSLGLTRPPRWGLGRTVLCLAAAWSVFQLSVTMPIANHLAGKKQDLSVFADLQWNVGMLAALLVAGWLLGAFAEELAYRGYLLTRVREALGSGRAGLLIAMLLSSILFGVAHTEQGLIGVLIVTVDAIYFGLMRLHYKTLWASVLAHGFNNTFGFIAFFLVGPIYGFW